VGSGSALPKAHISNEALSQRVETDDDWIRSRTGIGARRVAGPGETVTSLAAAAGRAALERAGWDPLELDLILLATSSPDDLFGTAPRVQAALGASNAVAFVEEPDKIAAKSQADRKNRQSFGRWDMVESKTNPHFARGSRLDCPMWTMTTP
jgi:3-hydroxy-3-methylglutaryl CoA synthase